MRTKFKSIIFVRVVKISANVNLGQQREELRMSLQKCITENKQAGVKFKDDPFFIKATFTQTENLNKSCNH